jgi:adenylate kinase family enzyme
MRIVVMGPSGSGKTWISEQLAQALAVPHVELDALHHEPDWGSCGPDVLRARVLAATEDDGWVADGTYHTMIGELVFERAERVAWIDLPVPVVMTRLLRRTHVRKRDRIELWAGNREGPWRESVRYLIWPAFKRAYRNRRDVPELLARHPHLQVHHLRSDRAVRAFIDSFAGAPPS